MPKLRLTRTGWWYQACGVGSIDPLWLRSSTGFCEALLQARYWDEVRRLCS